MKNIGNLVSLRGTLIFWIALSSFSIANGQTTVAQWQGDKKGAVSITFDDGLTCQFQNYTYGPGDDNAIAGLNYWADQAASQYKWAIEIFHVIDTGYDVVSNQAFGTHMDYLSANEPNLWVAPMGTVAHYIYERNAASINLLAQDINSIKLDLHCCGLDSRFDAPLTLLTDCPPDWASSAIRAKQDQTPLIANIVSKNGHLYIMYNAEPDAGTIELSSVDIISTPLPADFNFDGMVDYGDLLIFSQTWLFGYAPCAGRENYQRS